MTLLRTLIWFAIAAAAMLGAVWLAERPGNVTVEWRGWRLDTSVGVLLVAVAALQPVAARGVASRASLAASFPAMAKAAMAEDLADDSFGQRLLGKLKGLVSLRRIGADVPGDSVEAKLARAEAAINAGDVAKAVDLVKSLPPQTSRATADWLARAEAHLAAQRAVDQLAAQAVAMLGSAR